jgi:hypothetical protein
MATMKVLVDGKYQEREIIGRERDSDSPFALTAVPVTFWRDIPRLYEHEMLYYVVGDLIPHIITNAYPRES